MNEPDNEHEPEPEQHEHVEPDDSSSSSEEEDEVEGEVEEEDEEEEEEEETHAVPAESSDEETATANEDPTTVVNVLLPPPVNNAMRKNTPKMRIKLSLRKLPTLANRKSPTTTVSEQPPKEDIDIDSTKPSTAATKRKPNPSRPIRIPPIASPGLLMVPPGSSNTTTSVKKYVTPTSVFDQNMEMAGYTTEARSKRPHRGSSVQRQIGDMFDSNVSLSLRFPSMVPPDLMKDDKIPHLLMQSLDPKDKKRTPCGPTSFRDMMPASLSIPYPEDFIEKRVKYVQEVEARERAIIAHQHAEEAMEMSKESTDATGDKPPVNPITIPPIPEPPEPPQINEMGGNSNWQEEKFETKDHPIYFPKGKESFVTHLDKDCFHISTGRYFGLRTNWIADPNFVGPNAPGMSGLNASGGSGLGKFICIL
jgi:hypothetical protein